MTALQLAVLCVLAVSTAQTRQPVNKDALVQKEFSDRVAEYVELRKTLESKLPPLPDRAEPETMMRHQQALRSALQRARRGARQGDIFSRDIRHRIRRLIGGALSHENSAPRQAVREENPGNIPLQINGAFPTSLPRPTVPPQLLLVLPRLPDEQVEYRFLGTRLLLLDSRANMVIDYMTRALPK
jgi:hypothetical protein